MTINLATFTPTTCTREKSTTWPRIQLTQPTNLLLHQVCALTAPTTNASAKQATNQTTNQPTNQPTDHTTPPTNQSTHPLTKDCYQRFLKRIQRLHICKFLKHRIGTLININRTFFRRFWSQVRPSHLIATNSECKRGICRRIAGVNWVDIRHEQ